MRIVQINSVCNKGSTGKICVAVSELLSKKGVENYILYSRWKSDYPLAIKYENDHYARWQALREKVFGTYGFEAKSATKRLIRHLEEIKPDIVHLHVLHSHDVNLTMLFDYLREKHIKVFWTFHDCWAVTGYCPYFDMLGCNKWKTNCNNCPDRKRFSWFVDRSDEMHKRRKTMVKGLDLTIITPSKWMAGVVKESFMRDFPVKVINNGIDLNIFKPIVHSDSGLDELRHIYALEGKKILLGVADVWSERKGLKDYQKLAGILPEDMIIVLIGLEERQREKLPKSILGLPRTKTQRELVDWYSLADVVLNLSYEETFGMTTVEGFACGTPCVAYNKTASTEFNDGNTCKIVEAGNIVMVLSAVKELLTFGQKELKQTCRELALRQYDQKDVFGKYVALYSEQWGDFNSDLRIILGVADVWSARKGLPDFIKLREVLDEHYLIVLVGVTEDVQKVLPKGILGIRRTQNQTELAQMYAAADFFVNPTYEDNYPTTNLESMACGTPVITYRTGGSPEAITGDTGWVIDKGDVDAVANLILREGHKDRDKMRIECRKRAVGYFNINRCFDRYVRLYL